ncbi:GNAT family N-acetyltransferase [Streptomyces sp. NPDC059906]|uniref:GNAT family N-acetyltransferase n=1 Tax=Streptomyces sp. NPDC059906 TaxID=3346997 RepID=UPI0036581245
MDVQDASQCESAESGTDDRDGSAHGGSSGSGPPGAPRRPSPTSCQAAPTRLRHRNDNHRQLTDRRRLPTRKRDGRGCADVPSTPSGTASPSSRATVSTGSSRLRSAATRAQIPLSTSTPSAKGRTSAQRSAVPSAQGYRLFMNKGTLTGRTVRLVPLSVDHAAPLFPSASDPEVWQWMPRPRPESLTEMRTMLRAMLEDPARQCFAVQRLDDEAVIGSTSLYELDLAQGRAEIGATWFDRSCWGGPFNAESKLLLFSHAFDTLGLARVALRTDNLNERSQKALTRLGLVYEGTLRSHMVRHDGTRRDSLYYSLLADEWPLVRDELLARIAVKGRHVTGQ